MKLFRTLTLFSLALTASFFMHVSDAYAGNLKGYAWSSNIGWVSMSCDNDASCGTSNYGANVTPSGIIEGYVWSPFIGWITFNQAELGGCPAGVCEARFTKTAGQASGWMRACAVFASGCAGALKPSSLRGGWDGWVHLRGGSGVNAYGVFASGTVWNSYAWGGGNDVSGTDGVIGWLSFSGPGYSVVGTDPDAQSEGPLVSCGGKPGATVRNRDVLWTCTTYGVTPSNLQWNFVGTGVTPAANPVTVSGSASIVKRYSQVGDKSATVVVNPGAANQFDAGATTGAVLNGIDPGYGTVQIGDFDLEGQRPSVSAVTEGDSAVFRGNIRGQNINPAPLTIPFTNVFEVALDGGNKNASGGGTCPAAGITADVSLQTPTVTSINDRQDVPVRASWANALYGTTGSHCVRLCADDQDVIVETDEPSLNRNCSPWRYFEVTKLPPPPITASCTATPTLIKEKGSATWTVTPGGGAGTYTYSWSGTDGLSGTAASVTKQYMVAGTKDASVTVTSPGAPNSPLTLSCSTILRVQRVEEF